MLMPSLTYQYLMINCCQLYAVTVTFCWITKDMKSCMRPSSQKIRLTASKYWGEAPFTPNIVNQNFYSSEIWGDAFRCCCNFNGGTWFASVRADTGSEDPLSRNVFPFVWLGQG